MEEFDIVKLEKLIAGGDLSGGNQQKLLSPVKLTVTQSFLLSVNQLGLYRKSIEYIRKRPISLNVIKVRLLLSALNWMKFLICQTELQLSGDGAIHIRGILNLK